MALVPAAPEAGLSLGLILLAIACVFLLALNKTWKLTVGALLTAMADMVSSLPHVTILGHRVPPWDAFAHGITQLDNYVLQAIGVGIQQTEKGLHALIGAMTWLLQETADQVAGLAEDTWRGLNGIKRVVIPALLGAAVEPLARQIAHLYGLVKAAASHPVRAVHTTVRVIAPGLKALDARVGQLEAKVAAIGSAGVAAVSSPPISITLPQPQAIPGDITRGLGSLWKRVRRIGKTLTPAGIVGLVAAAVGTMGLTYTRCRNTSKYGKNLCGMNPDLLDSLIADTLLVLGTISLVEFAEGMQTIVGEASSEIQRFWRAD